MMASNRPGRIREKRSRNNKPYERPKGLIGRVRESMTGLFSGSWISNWLQSEECGVVDDDRENVEASISTRQCTGAPPGESFIFAQAAAGRRTVKKIYPEEGEFEDSSMQSFQESVLTRSAGNRGGSFQNTTHMTLSQENPGPSHQKVSLMYSPALTKSDLETPHLPVGDDGSDASESSGETGAEAVVVHAPEQDYRRDVLRLDEGSLRSLRETLSRVPVSVPTHVTSCDESRKRQRPVDPLELCVEKRQCPNLFSESRKISEPQPSCSSKRPRFNVSPSCSLYVGQNSSILSDSSFKSSPFYPGKTMFGGSSACRRIRMLNKMPVQNTSQHKDQSCGTTGDVELSQTAQRILDCLEKMSTPLSDAKKIPTPLGRNFTSYLDTASYTAAFHKHRPNLSSNTMPPTSKLVTTSKVDSKLNVGHLNADRQKSAAESDSIIARVGGVDEKQSEPSFGYAALSESIDPDPCVNTQAVSTSKSSSMGQVAVSEPAGHGTGSYKHTPCVPPAPLKSCATMELGTSCNWLSTTSTATTIVTTSTTVTTTSSTLSSTALLERHAGGGKIATKVSDLHRSSKKTPSSENFVPTLTLSAVPLTITTLPKIDFSESVDDSSGSFKFSQPEVIAASSKERDTLLDSFEYKFSEPCSVDTVVNNNPKRDQFVYPKLSGIDFIPKRRTNTEQLPQTTKISDGSVLDILKPRSDSSVNISGKGSALSENESRSCTESQGFGQAFKKAVDQWECSTCMVRNKNSDARCIACSSLKQDGSLQQAQAQSIPGTGKEVSEVEWDCSVCMAHNKDSFTKCGSCLAVRVLTNTPHGFGDQFKLGQGEWECDTCLVRNKKDSVKCASCETPKPGASLVVESALTGKFNFDKPTDSPFKFGVNNTSSTTFKFGVCDSSSATASQASKMTEPSSSVTGFKFGVNVSAADGACKSSSVSAGFSRTESGSLPSTVFTFGVPHSSAIKVDEKPQKRNVESPCSQSETGQSGSTGNANSPDTSGSTVEDKSGFFLMSSDTGKTGMFTLGVSEKTSPFKSCVKVDSFTDSSPRISEFSKDKDIKSGSSTDLDKPLQKRSDAKPLQGSSDVLKTNVPTFGSGIDSTRSTIFSFGDPKTSTFQKVETAPSTSNVFSFGSQNVPTDTAKGPSVGADNSSLKKLDFPFKFQPKETPCAVSTLANGIDKPDPIFTFGNINKVSSGPGFGSGTVPNPPGTSSQVFQFGNNSMPASQMSVFSHQTPAFGSNEPFSNKSNAIFTFGQNPDKKVKTGFNFGQPVSSPSFNFTAGNSASSTCTSAPNAVFQFGQSSAAGEAPVNSQFSFCSSVPNLSSPGENRVSATSNRVIRKAVRRIKK